MVEKAEMKMLDDRERSLIRALLYPVQFESRLEQGIERVMAAVVAKKSLGAGSGEYRDAIRSGLASKEPLSKIIPQSHDEQAIRRYLERVLNCIEIPTPRKVSKLRAIAISKPVAIKQISTRQLASALAEQHEWTKKQGAEMLEDLAALITKHLKKGERVKLAGLGILQVRKRAARMGRNPATGEAIKIRASKKVAFRASKDLKEAI